LDEFTYLLADFTSCKFTNGEESIIKERNSMITERTANVPCKIIKKNKLKINKYFIRIDEKIIKGKYLSF
jgi:hypothetical protein